MRFDGLVVLVAGASGGIGAAVAELLAARGAHLVLGYHTRPDRAATLAARCVDLGAQVLVQHVDVTDTQSVDGFAAAALVRFGQIDVLINSAGSWQLAPAEAIEAAQWATTLAVVLDGHIALCRAVVRPMMKRRSGRIVVISGLHGIAGGPLQADYSAAAGALLGATRALAREMAPWNITVNAVAPGLIDTPLTAALPADLRAWGERVIALRRAGTPAEAAAAAVFLASPLASYITGQTLVVDGGWHMA